MNGARSASATAATASPASRPSITRSCPLVRRLHRDQRGQQRGRHEVHDPGHPRLLHPGRRHRQPGQLEQVAAQRRRRPPPSRAPSRSRRPPAAAAAGPASPTATTAAITCTPGGTNGVSASATTAPPSGDPALDGGLREARCSRGHSRARNAAGTTASSAAWAVPPSAAGTERAEHRGGVPDDEDRRAAGEERQPGHRAVGGGDRQRRRLVDDPVRRPQPAQDAARSAAAARAGRRRRCCGCPAAARCRSAASALPPAPSTPTSANCEAPVNISSDRVERLPDVQPGRDGGGAERRAVEADGEAQADGVAEHPGADGGGHSGEASAARRCVPDHPPTGRPPPLPAVQWQATRSRRSEPPPPGSPVEGDRRTRCPTP